MASGLCNWAKDGIPNYLFDSTALTQPSAWWVQCHTGAPGGDGTGNVSAYSSRTQVTGGWDTASGGGGATANSSAVLVSFSGGSETISAISIWDASTSGNCICYGDLTQSKTPADGDSINFAIGEIDITFS